MRAIVKSQNDVKLERLSSVVDDARFEIPDVSDVFVGPQRYCCYCTSTRHAANTPCDTSSCTISMKIHFSRRPRCSPVSRVPYKAIQ
ncbi:hypothetical protein PISMIDRAFT_621518 [Pisolithus microcarpus 441]|uniref:Uncharacterized protein n=1 Tax=Pisolithus microcarpus 441 TaxID=765257 RepID=A0A0C9ZHY8_9AGAM|nr:hypothetical protein PISMIDRAFT_621518 [Pisolithus microcarpus 441]